MNELGCCRTLQAFDYHPLQQRLFSRWQRDFANDANTRPAKTYRIANEVPTLLMIGIVVLVIVKPF